MAFLLIFLLAYALYFDYKRRNDPEFRKILKRNIKKQAKTAVEEAEKQIFLQRQVIKAAVERAKEEGFPTDVGERESFFMDEVGKGESLGSKGIH